MADKASSANVEPEDVDCLSPDSTALIDPKADKLGYAPFASHLANSICEMAFTGGMIIGVYGPWNSGKSTLLNFIVHYLKQKPEDEQPLIVPFNPWLFSGEADITRRFFDQIQSVVTTWKFVPSSWKDRIADFGKLFSQIPLPYAQAGNAVAEIFDDNQKNAADFKEEIENTLGQDHPRIIVTIDDVDRLDVEEIKKLFRLIKTFPYFTDVVYLLFFDKEIVIKALADTQELSGQNYLNKLIQLSFEIPSPDKLSLRRVLFDNLNTVFTDTPNQIFDQTYWSKVYYQGIDHFINKPRDIVSLLDNLNVKYSVVKGEVNLVDFIAVESLRVFCPVIYNTIRKNPWAFVEKADKKGLLISTDELKRLHNSWIAQLQDEDKEPVKRLLLCLFPKLELVWGNTDHTGQQSIWSKELRICSSEIFPTYFRLVLPEVTLSTTELKAILSLAQDSKAFGESLVELSEQKLPGGTTQVRIFLELLENDPETNIPLDCIPSVVQSLFDVGDQLLPPEDEPCGMFDFGNDVRIGHIIWQLLRQLHEPVRFEVLKAAMSNGNAFSTIVREVATLARQQGKYGAQPSPEEEWLISVQHFDELEELVLKRVQAENSGRTENQKTAIGQFIENCEL